MGKRIVKAPPAFERRKDHDGRFISGAHLPLLYDMPQESLSCFQIYEDVTEATPVSPIFPSEAALKKWLVSQQGYSVDAVQQFMHFGFAPSAVIEPDGTIVDSIEGMRQAKTNDASA